MGVMVRCGWESVSHSPNHDITLDILARISMPTFGKVFYEKCHVRSANISEATCAWKIASLGVGFKWAAMRAWLSSSSLLTFNFLGNGKFLVVWVLNDVENVFTLTEIHIMRDCSWSINYATNFSLPRISLVLLNSKMTPLGPDTFSPSQNTNIVFRQKLILRSEKELARNLHRTYKFLTMTLNGFKTFPPSPTFELFLSVCFIFHMSK